MSRGRGGHGGREGSEALDEAGSEGAETDTVVGPVMCGRQIVQLMMNAFSDTSGILIPDQTEEGVAKNNLLSGKPRIFYHLFEEHGELVRLIRLRR